MQDIYNLSIKNKLNLAVDLQGHGNLIRAKEMKLNEFEKHPKK
jgi:hypothetical protein